MTCFPLNPNTLRSQFYPTEDESLEVEVHFVNKLDGKLIKVLRLLAKDVGFTHELVAQFKDSAQTSRNSELFYQHVRLFFAEHDKDECLITKSTAIILKQHSDNDEPELNAIMTIVDEALSLTEDEMNRLEEIAASQN
ncbi:hypothetical protein ERJ77_20070 [Vibrio anguillarum]|nr:hypothetical protein [Vibrio anguillarum]